jgi:hypothetical protein
MCREVTCKTCKQPTWSGCGAHVEQVLGHIPRDERCQCAGRAKAAAAAGGSTQSWFSRRRGRQAG